ncbi:mechanosensitive ion channel family protein [Solimonas soli]|uniref:mechanosensitive ion channel family protein n=1 Tax=Solimonas soli TaxID=413479 RepID=UPI0004B5FDE0|nr:mechanosensitive ion channel domain-containing protein [Solimonas soli]
MRELIDSLQNLGPDWAWTGIAACLSLLVVLGGMHFVHRLVLRAASHSTVMGLVVRRTHAPLTIVVAIAALNLVWQAAPDDIPLIGVVRRVSVVLWIASLTWLALRGVALGGDAVVELNPYNMADNLHARMLLTRTRVLTRTLYVIILLVGLSLALMAIPGVRQIGTSLLASAGIGALAIGLAARPVLGNLLAGLQLAITQPIRIDDVLVLEGEWGRVEEITGTYVVVAIWDQRRLVVPLQYFIEKPFQNWTRQTSQILGTVMLWVDYRLPVDAVRAELKRLVEGDKDWDRRVAIAQVTDTSEQTMQLRVLLSSADSGRNFDLRCRVREALISFIAREYPLYLPHTRAELMRGETPPGAPPPGPRSDAPASSPTPTLPQA